ncbi:hypothetical protein COCOBI_12-5220 [Coccomyxa sp. Obi]|nr:hypothetical protein COCOBI_12-5220 [Coccomyxa sp. Obi]
MHGSKTAATQAEEEVRDPQRSKSLKADGATIWRVGSKRKREDDQVKRLRTGEWWPSAFKPAPREPAPEKQMTEGQQGRAAESWQPSVDLQEQLEAALERAAKAEAARAAAARDLTRTQALKRLARAAEQHAIKERRAMRAQMHHVRAERKDLMAKAEIAKHKAKGLWHMASKQGRMELEQMRDDRKANTTKLLSQSAVGCQLAAAKETVRELSNKLIKQRTWRKEAAAIFEECGVQGPCFKPNTAPAQCATSSPVPAQHMHASVPHAPAHCATSLPVPAEHASAPPAPAQCAASLFMPAQHASSPPAPAPRTHSPLPPTTPPLFPSSQ